MKKLLIGASVAALALVGVAAPAQADTVTYDLIARGGSVATSIDIGDVVVSNDGSTITVDVVVNGELDGTNNIPTRLYGISAKAGCAVTDFPLSKGNPVPGQFDYQMSFPDGVTSHSFTLSAQPCAKPLVAVHADAKELGGYAGLELVLPSAVTFRVVQDTGSDPDASYFDTTFTVNSGPLSGQTINGWCVDIGHTINLNTPYAGTAYSIFDLPTGPVGNIDKPQNLLGVMWLLNNYAPGMVVDWTDDGVANGVVLTSGTIQRAIWYIVDNSQSTSGLGTFNEAQALYLAGLAMTHLDYAPADLCGQLIPVILVTNVGTIQTTIAQTTLVALGVPCETISDTAMAMNTAVKVTEKGSVRYGEQFPGSNWFSYVYAPAPVVVPVA